MTEKTREEVDDDAMGEERPTRYDWQDKHPKPVKLSFPWYLLLKPGEEEPACMTCKTQKDITFAPDPYNSDIDGDYTNVWLCSDCSRDRADDI